MKRNIVIWAILALVVLVLTACATVQQPKPDQVAVYRVEIPEQNSVCLLTMRDGQLLKVECNWLNGEG